MTRSELLQKLKAKRKELADREGVELFMVFTNKTLEETVKAMPATMEDLALVKGWGKTKIAKYGAEVLQIVYTASSGNVAEVELPQHGEKGGSGGSPTPAIFSVSEFLDAVNITLARLGIVQVRGEVSELRRRGSAVYFTLKDAEDEATVKCVLWAWKFEREYHYLQDGMEVIVHAAAEVYPKFGTFNLRVEKLEPVGEGALQKAFEALKKKLEAKGFFDAARKRPIPQIIQRIGVITSEKGEAINDFLKNIGEYGFEIILMDVRVEGDQAESSIVAALRHMNTRRPDLDVVCLIRGGGGLENLKAFNSERIAEAIVASRIPVLTGIGHERDETIAGFSSDANFSTPTKVADAIRRGREELLRMFEKIAESITSRVEELLQETVRHADMIVGMAILLPERILERMRARVSGATYKMETALGRIFAAYHLLVRQVQQGLHISLQQVERYSYHVRSHAGLLEEHLRRVFQKNNQRILVAEATLIPLDPEAPLRRGYGIVQQENGKVLKRAQDVTIGERIIIRLHKGIVQSIVKEKQ